MDKAFGKWVRKPPSSPSLLSPSSENSEENYQSSNDWGPIAHDFEGFASQFTNFTSQVIIGFSILQEHFLLQRHSIEALEDEMGRKDALIASLEVQIAIKNVVNTSLEEELKRAHKNLKKARCDSPSSSSSN
ncbi:hypothetical protein AMTR_s00012p00186930 [Amborella trichopoda]|uniref:Uncharacterized protein n=1 Tax=Amborella trichopoda TaxID=13333 RepID=W1PJJ0_AMBTC|nr:hypothetical protein AMTR_s00012p00186930 [Amborella trichopoda]